MICLRQQIRHVLRCMPRGVARRYDYFAKFESVAIFDFLGVNTVLCAQLAATNPCRREERTSAVWSKLSERVRKGLRHQPRFIWRIINSRPTHPASDNRRGRNNRSPDPRRDISKQQSKLFAKRHKVATGS